MSAQESPIQSSALFREQAVKRFRGVAWQPALLSTRLSGFLLTIFAIFAGVGLAGFATTFEFARKEQTQGHLTPAAGWSRIAAKSFGVVRARHVQPGDKVRTGDVLLEMSSGDGLQRALTVQERMLEEIRGRRRTLEERLTLVELEYRNEVDLLARASESNRRELTQLDQEIDISEAQLRISRKRYRDGERLASSGALSQAELVELEVAELSRRLSLSERQRDAERLQANLAANDAYLKQLIVERDLKQASIREQLHSLAIDESRTRGAGASSFLAPRSGVVASVRVRPGDSVRPGDILLDIVPEDGEIQARLFAQSTAMGFVEPGQEVRVYLDAFPYERHGAQSGRVVSVSDTAFTPTGSEAGEGVAQTVYRIDVEFPNGFDLPPAQLRALRPGMTVTADLVRDYGTLADWLLEPLRGSVKRL